MRLVVYAGPPRIPTPIFNEKVMAGLGAGLDQPARCRGGAREGAGRAAPYRLLIDQMKVKQTHVVATAAVRDANDGADFVREIERIGFDCEVLSAEEEAHLAGEGVLSGIPEADGIVGDLGGGSLELVDVARRPAQAAASRCRSACFGSMPSAKGERDGARSLKAALKQSGSVEAQRAAARFYMVGGSWRALARIDMIATDFPLPITHQYRMKPARARELRNCSQAPTPAAERQPLRRALRRPRLRRCCSTCWSTSSSLEARRVDLRHPRRPALFEARRREPAAIDPLIEEARDAGGGEHRFGQHGDLLDAGSRRCSRTPGNAAAAARVLPACRRRVAGEPAVSAPTAESKWRCTAIGRRSMRAAG